MSLHAIPVLKSYGSKSCQCLIHILSMGYLFVQKLNSFQIIQRDNKIQLAEKKNRNYMYRNDPKFSDRYAWANSADPDQTAPEGAV